jgi:hypothetical protein
MPQTRRNRKLGRWRRETWARERPLDEVPAAGLRRIELPPDLVASENEPHFDAEGAELAVALQELRKKLRRWRWIPWRRGKRPELEALIAELRRQRQQIRDNCRQARPQ